MKTKKIPMRMCVGCGQMKPKAELTRVVKTPEDQVLIDNKGKMNGRGAYVCKNVECLNSAHKSKRLERAFKQQISEEIYLNLKKDLLNE
ncbi:MAG: YlxR family protein [Clostridia bacterium]|nr:YlxR family protein [Clostridia bacterium]